MPTKYRGRVEITCQSETCKNDAARENVGVDCLECAQSAHAVIDLNNKPIGKLKKKEAEKPAKTTKEVKNDGL